MKKRLLLNVSTVLMTGALLTACSQQTAQIESGSGQQATAPATTKAVSPKANAHTHPANKCTRSISHAHPNGLVAHTHHYSCKGNNKTAATANGHVHPANSLTHSVRHSHPNGKNKHSHHYSK